MDMLVRFFSTIPIELLAAIVTLLAGVATNVLTEEMLPKLRRRFRPEAREAPKSYKEQMANLTRSLVKASADVDRILQEMTEVTQQREGAIVRLEQQLDTLSDRERQLQQEIETLEKIPLPAAKYFASIVERTEKRSAWRDYALFGLGVVVSTVIAIVLRLFGV